MQIEGSTGPAPTWGSSAPVPLSAQRLAVLEHLRSHAPVRAGDTAAALGLHPNTIRQHLDALIGLGLVDRSTETTGARGRPAAWYRPSAADPDTSVHAFATLATVLAGQLARSAHAERDARAAGVAWGHELIAEGDGGDPRRTVLDALARLGFAPDETPADALGIALRRCPLLDAARRHPDVVCRVHLGIVVGMWEKLAAPGRSQPDLIAFAEPGACRLLLPR